MMSTCQILQGDCRAVLKTLPDASVQCVVTSPPYFGLRDYGVDGQIGLEATLEEFVEEMVAVFREVRRVLRDDGTLWLNLGDTYATQGGPGWQGKNGHRGDRRFTGTRNTVPMREQARTAFRGFKPKDLIGVPWMVAFALRADGWWLRQDIIWHKPNPMPESVTDRCTKGHEYLFLFAKSERYYFDQQAIAEEAVFSSDARVARASACQKHVPTQMINGIRPRASRKRGEFNGKTNSLPGREAFRAIVEERNKRSVWTVPTQPFRQAHFATFPEDLIKPCIMAGCPEGGAVLDPFGGSGTTGRVALELGRNAILIELNPDYVKLAEKRTHVTPGFVFAPEEAAS